MIKEKKKKRGGKKEGGEGDVKVFADCFLYNEDLIAKDVELHRCSSFVRGQFVGTAKERKGGGVEKGRGGGGGEEKKERYFFCLLPQIAPTIQN